MYGLCNQKRIGEDLKQVCTLQREQICKKKIAQISFRDDDLSRIQTPHDGPLVVNLRVRDCDVQTILIDEGSIANVLFLETFKKLWPDESRIHKSSSSLIGFQGTKVTPIGMVTLTVEAAARTVEVEFIIIDARSTFNAIMGRGWMHEMESFHPTSSVEVPLPRWNQDDRYSRRSSSCSTMLQQHNPRGVRSEGEAIG